MSRRRQKENRAQNPIIPRTGPDGAAHGEAAGQSRAEQVGTPTGWYAQKTTFPLDLQNIRSIDLNVSSEARTHEILCKLMEKHNER